MSRKAIELSGRRFGRLVVLERRDNDKKGQAMWLCECDCKNKTVLTGQRLLRGHTQSCGCLQREIRKECHTKHGMKGTRLYEIWKSMKKRCINPNQSNYKNYGGRGITVCEEWRNNFQAFYDWAMANGYKPDAKRGECTIDRINNEGNYEPTNCRWITIAEQNRNKRKYKKRGEMIV